MCGQEIAHLAIRAGQRGLDCGHRPFQPVAQDPRDNCALAGRRRRPIARLQIADADPDQGTDAGQRGLVLLGAQLRGLVDAPTVHRTMVSARSFDRLLCFGDRFLEFLGGLLGAVVGVARGQHAAQLPAHDRNLALHDARDSRRHDFDRFAAVV